MGLYSWGRSARRSGLDRTKAAGGRGMRWSCLRQTLGAGGRLGASLACGGSWAPASTTPAGPDALLDVSSYPDDIRKCGGKNAIVGQPTGHRKIREWSLNVRI